MLRRLSSGVSRRKSGSGKSLGSKGDSDIAVSASLSAGRKNDQAQLSNPPTSRPSLGTPGFQEGVVQRFQEPAPPSPVGSKALDPVPLGHPPAEAPEPAPTSRVLHFENEDDLEAYTSAATKVQARARGTATRREEEERKTKLAEEEEERKKQVEWEAAEAERLAEEAKQAEAARQAAAKRREEDCFFP